MTEILRMNTSSRRVMWPVLRKKNVELSFTVRYEYLPIYKHALLNNGDTF